MEEIKMEPNEFEVIIRDILPYYITDKFGDESVKCFRGIKYFTSSFSPSNGRYNSAWQPYIYPRKTISELKELAQKDFDEWIPPRDIKEKKSYVEGMVKFLNEHQEKPEFLGDGGEDIEFGDKLHIVLGEMIENINIPQLCSYKVLEPSLYRTHRLFFHLLEHLTLSVSPVTRMFSGNKYSDIINYLDSKSHFDLHTPLFKDRGDIKTEDELTKKIITTYNSLRETSPFLRKDHKILTERFLQCKSLLSKLY